MSDLRHGDVLYHTGLVLESYHDLTVMVDIPSISDDPLTIGPEAVTPMRWRPREGARIAILQRGTTTIHLNDGLTWLGEVWKDDEEQEHIILPTYLDNGTVHLVSELASVVVALVDDLDDTGEFLLLGRSDSAEPLVCGDLYKTWMESTLDEINLALAALDSGMTQAAAGFTAISGTVILTSSSGAPAHTHTVTLPATPSGSITAAAAQCAASRASLITLKGQIEDHLSELAMTSKV